MNVPVILSTGSLYHFDLDTVMALAAEVGFAGLELLVDGRRETYHPPHLEKLMARHRLPILAVHSPFATFPPPWPRDPVSRIKQSVHLAESLGAQIVVVHPPIRWVRVQGLVLAAQSVWKLSLPLPWAGPGRLGRWLQQELPTFQAQTRVKIAVENMPRRRVGPWQLEPYHFNNAAQLNRFPYLTLDTTHVGTWREDLLHFYRQVKPKVAHIHLSNYNGREHQLLHCGLLPLAAFLTELAQDNFDGLVSLELGPISLQADDETKLKQNLQASLAFCQQALISSKLA